MSVSKSKQQSTKTTTTDITSALPYNLYFPRIKNSGNSAFIFCLKFSLPLLHLPLINSHVVGHAAQCSFNVLKNEHHIVLILFIIFHFPSSSSFFLFRLLPLHSSSTSFLFLSLLYTLPSSFFLFRPLTSSSFRSASYFASFLFSFFPPSPSSSYLFFICISENAVNINLTKFSTFDILYNTCTAIMKNNPYFPAKILDFTTVFKF